MRETCSYRHYYSDDAADLQRRQLDILRAGLRIAMMTIRKIKHGQHVDADAVLRKASIRADAKEVRDAVKTSRSG
jgi:hypothetical protein